jgi:hypothetical protein
MNLVSRFPLIVHLPSNTERINSVVIFKTDETLQQEAKLDGNGWSGQSSYHVCKIVFV